MADQIEQVLAEDRLLRRVRYLDPSYVRDDMTVTSFAFTLKKSKGETGLSVDIERLTTFEKSISDRKQFRLFRLVCKEVRDLGLDCIHKPEAENFAHAEITGNITKSISSRLAKSAIYVAYP